MNIPHEDKIMFLESIALTHATPCLAEPGKIIVTGKPSCRLDEALPFLATLPNVIGYIPSANTLTLRRQPGLITLFSQRVSITQVKDVQEGLELLEALKDAINATWEHRHALKPVTQRRLPPGPLDVYPVLPQTNCKQCGEATCMAFAVGLLQQRRQPGECLPLNDPVFTERLAALEAMFANMNVEA
jgi:ArsR family metal-binding transcriptional regulator